MNANCEGTGSVLDGVTIGRELSAKAVYLLACEAGTRSNDETAMANKVVDACSARCLAHAGVVEVARVFNDLPDDGANGDHTKHLYGTTMLRNAFVELIHSFRDGANEPRAIVEVIDKMIAEIEPDLPADPGPFAETRLAWSTVIRKNFRSLIIQSK